LAAPFIVHPFILCREAAGRLSTLRYVINGVKKDMFSSLPFPLRVRLSKEKRWVIFIHGMGATEKSWTDPCAEVLAGGTLPFDFVLTDCSRPPERMEPNPFLRWKILTSTPLRLQPVPPTPFWEILRGEAVNLLAWSQRDSFGPIARAVEELSHIVGLLPRGAEIVLIGHSRGGLVARRFIQEQASAWKMLKGVILLGSPNRGSRIAALARVLGEAWFLALLENIFPRDTPFSLPRALGHVRAYLKRAAITELAPDSPLIAEVVQGETKERESGIPYINLIGTRTTYIRFYRIVCQEPWHLVPLFSLFDSLETFIPQALLPPEVRQGRGDGQVSVESACLSWSRSSRLFHVNHAQFLIDRDVQGQVLQALREI